ncbi:hypothetical protein [Fructilactobacillus florum]|uniref:Uncharacterized protein n=1 Tax=Fructilactobacillus florum DSM 22689 = JCM 16035 TaxID=1423745 RepID=A0A0R2CJZ3_9LACO|nr:hypothetical protein [Fructilactobacillus florum]KRM91594.1 hypothetical protein FC87_GL000726 [Fructilactobacillus florum DSM 22689 = JCM 16035]
MDEVTPKYVKSSMPIFADFTDEDVQARIDEAKTEVDVDKIDEKMVNVAIVTFARHLLYLDYFTGNGGVTSAGTLGNTQTIADMHNDDPYLQRYQSIVEKYGISSNYGSVTSDWYE